MRNAIKALASVAVHDPGDIRITWGRGQCAEIRRPHYGHGHFGDDYGYGANLAASLPKVAVMYSSFKGFERGSLRESPEAIQDLQAMIRSSSNAAATRLIQELGVERIASEPTSPAVELYDQDRGGGLWVGRAYSKSSLRLPDPVGQVTHGANAYQVCHFTAAASGDSVKAPRT